MCQLATGWSVPVNVGGSWRFISTRTDRFHCRAWWLNQSIFNLPFLDYQIISIYYLYIYIHTFPHTLQRPGPKHLTLRKGSPSGRVARSRPSGWKPMAGLQWRSANQGKTSFAAWHSADALKTHPRHWWQHATSEKIPYSRIFCFNKD